MSAPDDWGFFGVHRCTVSRQGYITVWGSIPRPPIGSSLCKDTKRLWQFGFGHSFQVLSKPPANRFDVVIFPVGKRYISKVGDNPLDAPIFF